MSTASSPGPAVPVPPAATSRRRGGRVLSVLVALMAVAAVALGLRISEPPPYESVQGSRETAAELRTGEVTLGQITVGRVLDSFSEPLPRTEGLLVAIPVTVAATGTQTITVNRARLLAGEREYASWDSTFLRAEPGFATGAAVIFEVDPGQLDGLTVEVWNATIVSGFEQRAVFPLDVDTDTLAGWRATPADQLLAAQTSPLTTVIG